MEKTQAELYEAYLEIAKHDRWKRDVIDIYTSNWCVLTGRACVSPHPHRHYTFEEFKEAFVNDSTLRDFLNQ